MAKRTKKQMSAAGKRITNKAKQIRKANPGKKWTTCMKEAGRELRGKL